ncbi:hypothetical protein GGR58DRAFT_483450 [Xylaria digitata]|nr:hypothetical protein GGR58DRAFT_483450 [Xylaria digitata]
MLGHSPQKLFSRGFQSVKTNLKPVFVWESTFVRPDRSDLSEAGSKTSRESPSISSISLSGGSEASGNNPIELDEGFPTPRASDSYHISHPEAIPPELGKNNALGIPASPTILDQPQIQHKPWSSQRTDSLAPPVDTRAAGAGESSRDTQNKRQKNKNNPRVERVKKLIRAYDEGHRLLGQEVSRRTLYLNEYRQLLEDINGNTELSTIYKDNLRYDYIADNRGENNKREKQFSIRMPTKFHEYLSQGINKAIIEQQLLIKIGRAECGIGMCRGRYCKDFHTKEIAQRLNDQGHDTVKGSAEAESDKKDPDLSYKYDHPRSKFPGLVVEVGWSQKSLDLQKKCKWYIEKSCGEIRTVIGVDLNDLYDCYPKRKTKPNEPSEDGEDKATEEDEAKMAEATAKKKALGKILVWRADIDSDTGNATAVLDDDTPKIFRDENGEAFGEVALRLSLEDFVSKRIMEEIGASHNPEILLMSADLCYHFNRALRDQIPWDRGEEREKEKKEQKKKERKEQRENEKKKKPLTRRTTGAPEIINEWLRNGKKRISDHIGRK